MKVYYSAGCNCKHETMQEFMDQEIGMSSKAIAGGTEVSSFLRRDAYMLSAPGWR